MATWFFPEVEPFRVQGRGLAEDNFAAEDRKGEEILGREGYQNPLDARSPHNHGAVRVILNVLNSDQFDGLYLKQLLTDEYLARLAEASGFGTGTTFDFANPKVLVLEDFGTTGLNGNFLDSYIDGSGENWNAFWFREGEGAKSGIGSNGRAGQGKVTFYRTSSARAVFGLTVREMDGETLLMGRSSFRRNYTFNSHKYERDAFWCVTDGKSVHPIQDEDQIARFRDSFGLQRKAEPGLSLIIPLPRELDSSVLVRTAVADFYLPIARGRLEVQVGHEVIKKDNLDAVADRILTDSVTAEIKSSFSKGFRGMVQGVLADENAGKTPIVLKTGWEKGTRLTEANLPDGKLESLRMAFENGERISVRCPLTVKPKGKAAIETYFDVHLEVPDDLERTEEAYVRRDLLIGSEAHLASTSHLEKARGLTLIEDDAMSAFLADAEEPTHLKWNASRPRLAEDYKSPSTLVRAVRQAMPRLLSLMSGGDNVRDVKALSKYFAKPVDASRKHTPGGKNKGGGTEPDPDPPPPTPKPFKLVTGTDWIAVRPNGNAALTTDQLPFQCELEIAYEGLDLDPFAAYDPFDFDLGDRKTHEIEEIGVTITNISQNRIEFDVFDPDFALLVQGFDSKLRFRARLTYKEKEDGTDIDEEQSY